MPNSEGRIRQLSDLIVRMFAMNGITGTGTKTLSDLFCTNSDCGVDSQLKLS